MAFKIEDDETAGMVVTLARRLKTTEQDAVKRAVLTALENLTNEADFDQGVRELYDKFPKPEPTGLKADKAFFDSLSGDSD